MSAPVASAGMLIRRPPAVVFEAFTDPAVTTQFWFTHSTGPLEPGAEVRWTWAMYGASAAVRAVDVERGRRILMAWGEPGAMSEVEWRFSDHPLGCFVEVEHRGFAGDHDAQVRAALDATGGFALVLAAAKVWLEHGFNARLVDDRHPGAWAPGWVRREGESDD